MTQATPAGRLAPVAGMDDNEAMNPHTRTAIIRLSIDEELPEWFREACRKVIGDRPEREDAPR